MGPKVKLSNTVGFEKHLKEAFPSHLSPVYFVAISSETERRKMLHKIVSLLQQIDPLVQPHFYHAEENSIGVVLESLNTKPLLGAFPIVVLDGTEKLKKGDIQHLEPSITAPKGGYLILGGSSLKGFSEKVKKEMVILDLSDEKPWDKQNRIREWLIAYASKEKKKLAPDLISWLFTHLGTDLLTLEQELNKLITYTLGRELITSQDAKALSSAKEQVSSWQYAESLVWDGMIKGESPIQDVSSLLGFIGQIRYQLEIGYKISSLEKEGMPPFQIGEHFLQLKAGLFQKRIEIVRKRRPQFFKEALCALFQLELRCKTTSIDPFLLWDLFAARFIGR